MRNPSLLLIIVVFILAPFTLSAAADTVAAVSYTHLELLFRTGVWIACLLYVSVIPFMGRCRVYGRAQLGF